MKIEYTEDGDVPFDSEFKKGIVIFPETETEVLLIYPIKKFLEEDLLEHLKDITDENR